MEFMKHSVTDTTQIVIIRAVDDPNKKFTLAVCSKTIDNFAFLNASLKCLFVKAENRNCIKLIISMTFPIDRSKNNNVFYTICLFKV
jgi:hypothetical protein